jgi:DNA-directed RNA polymerase subunit RPC12/RpoP
MSEFKFSCPHCDQHLQCDERLGGKQIQCPACNHLIVIPASPAQVAAGNYAPESGKTWNTFIPPALKAKPKNIAPPPPG